MHYRRMFPDDPYMGAWDLEGRETVVVTIERITIEVLKNNTGKDERKPVAHFKGAQKGMVLNKTNCKTIAALYGPDTDKWVGERVELKVQEVTAFGGTHACLRVVPRRPQANTKPQPSEEV